MTEYRDTPMQRLPAREQRPRARRRSIWLSIAGYAGLAVVCLLSAAVTFLLIAAPVDLARDRAVELVKARTGRDLVVAGPTSLSWMPFGVSFSQVSLGAPSDMDGAPLLTAKSVQVEVPFLSMLSGKPQPSQVVVDGPTIELRVDADGRRSWDFPSLRTESVGTPRAQSGAGATPSADIRDRTDAPPSAHRWMAGSMRIRDGRVRFVDEKAGTSREASGLQAEFTSDEAGRLMIAKGKLAVAGETLVFEAKAAADNGRLDLDVSGNGLSARYLGTMRLGRDATFDGTVGVQAEAAALTRITGGRSFEPAGPDEALMLSARVAGGSRQIEISDLSATLGERSLSGALTVEMDGRRPRVRGELTMSELDVGRLLVKPGKARTKNTAATEPRRAAAVDPSAAQAGVRDRHKDKDHNDWSDDVIDLAPLGFADATLKVTFDRLTYRKVATGRGRLALTVEDKVAKAALDDLTLYEGRARGVVTLDGRGQVPAATVNLALDNVAARPLLSDAVDFTSLDGRANFVLAVSGRGQSERQMVETLQGKVELFASDGGIMGVDVAKLLSRVERGRLTGLNTAATDRTPFSELAASFQVADGVAQNQDLRLQSPHLQVTGTGSANLGQRRVDYTVKPKIAASAAGDKALVNLAGLEIPVRIEGSWDNPSFTPDLSGVLGNVDKAGDVLKHVGKNAQSEEFQNAVKDLLGGGESKGGKKKVKPGDLIEMLLKKE